jgi:hypothetical protein
MLRDLGFADSQGRERARDRAFAELVAETKPLSEAHDTRERIDDPELVIGGLGNEQAAVIGAEIERCVSARRGAKRAASAPGPALGSGYGNAGFAVAVVARRPARVLSGAGKKILSILHGGKSLPLVDCVPQAKCWK